MNKYNDKRGTLLFPIKNSKYNFNECTVSIININDKSPKLIQTLIELGKIYNFILIIDLFL